MLRLNRLPALGQPLEPADVAALGPAAAQEVQRLLALCPVHRTTPLHSLPALAQRLRVAEVFVKDESTRLGLGSFKALGGTYAVLRLVLEHASGRLHRSVLPRELESPDVRAVARELTVCCATDGNHGRAVAAAARFLGCSAVIFLHAAVSPKRAAAIEQLGATTIRVRGAYQEAVEAAARESERQGWTLVSDTSWPGYERIPRLVSQGYTAMVRETVMNLPSLPTHVFVQAGVGGLAAAVAGHLSLVYAGAKPLVVVVEASRAACLYESVPQGRPVAVAAGEPTIMAMLDCQEPSLVAWHVLERVAEAFMVVEEEDAVEAMRVLAQPLDNDTPVVAGESGGVGLAGLLKAGGDADIRKTLGLNENSSVLLINTEGAIDPESYAQLVGASPADVLGAARTHERVRTRT
jgi:diaminopropionate ammonia-lyase